MAANKNNLIIIGAVAVGAYLLLRRDAAAGEESMGDMGDYGLGGGGGGGYAVGDDDAAAAPDPFLVDSDGDGVPDAYDIFPQDASRHGYEEPVTSNPEDDPYYVQQQRALDLQEQALADAANYDPDPQGLQAEYNRLLDEQNDINRFMAENPPPEYEEPSRWDSFVDSTIATAPWIALMTLPLLFRRKAPTPPPTAAPGGGARVRTSVRRGPTQSRGGAPPSSSRFAAPGSTATARSGGVTAARTAGVTRAASTSPTLSGRLLAARTAASARVVPTTGAFVKPGTLAAARTNAATRAATAARAARIAATPAGRLARVVAPVARAGRVLAPVARVAAPVAAVATIATGGYVAVRNIVDTARAARAIGPGATPEEQARAMALTGGAVERGTAFLSLGIVDFNPNSQELRIGGSTTKRDAPNSWSEAWENTKMNLGNVGGNLKESKLNPLNWRN